MFQIHTSDISDAWDSMLHGLKDPGLRLLKAFTRTIDVVLTLAVPVDKSSMTTTVSWNTDLDWTSTSIQFECKRQTQHIFKTIFSFYNKAVCMYVSIHVHVKLLIVSKLSFCKIHTHNSHNLTANRFGYLLLGIFWGKLKLSTSSI